MCYFYILAFDLADVASPLLQIKNNLAQTIRMHANRSLHLFKQLTLGNKIKLKQNKDLKIHRKRRNYFTEYCSFH